MVYGSVCFLTSKRGLRRVLDSIPFPQSVYQLSYGIGVKDEGLLTEHCRVTLVTAPIQPSGTGIGTRREDREPCSQTGLEGFDSVNVPGSGPSFTHFPTHDTNSLSFEDVKVCFPMLLPNILSEILARSVGGSATKPCKSPRQAKDEESPSEAPGPSPRTGPGPQKHVSHSACRVHERGQKCKVKHGGDSSRLGQ